MSRYTGPITRISRRLKVMLFTNGSSKRKAFEKKAYNPGEHGQKRFSGKKSEYKKQLEEKQKARFLYGISEKQSRKYFEKAAKTEGVTGNEYLKLLEIRLDNVIYRSGLATTRPQARQIVNHGLVVLNGKPVKTPSILVKIGDNFEVRENRQKSKLFEEIQAMNVKHKTPKWLKSDISKLKGEVIAMPEKDDLEQIIQSQLITEFYSK